MQASRNRIKKEKQNSCLPVLIIILVIILGIFLYTKNLYDSTIFENSNNEEVYEIVVNEGENFFTALDKLNNEGYNKNKLIVQLYFRQKNLSPNIKIGTYLIPASYNIPELVTTLETNQLKPAKLVTIREGLRAEQIADILEESLTDNIKFNKSEFLDIVLNPSKYNFSEETQTIISRLKSSDKPLRGFLYPDTYRFDDDATTLEIVEILLENFIDKIDSTDLIPINQSNITNLYDALILASIIEKEASAVDDKRDISSVFHNRMEIGMAIQSDATVNFITGKNDAGALIEDTQIDSPYNTYLYPGLIPTPISNPGIDSIVAALKPNITEYFFFFHDDSGNPYYSETFAEHNQKVMQIRGSI